jgi:TPR repeat protein
MSRLREGENMNQPDAQTAPNYVTCPCQHCGGKIEFDANQLDATEIPTVPCPHCELQTTIFVPEQKVPPVILDDDLRPAIEIKHGEEIRKIRISAEQGEPEAQFNLGMIYYRGVEMPRDFAEVVKWWRKAAEQGHSDAQLGLGFVYQDGTGVQQDYVEGLRWFRLSAAQGNSYAQANLGVAYWIGERVPQDFAEAVKWFLKAAEQGHVEAQLVLGGKAYARGIGVSQNRGEAMKWLHMAAEQGYSYAQAALAIAYQYGDLSSGINLVEAYKWAVLATQTGAYESRERDHLAQQMTPSQIEEGQRLASIESLKIKNRTSRADRTAELNRQRKEIQATINRNRAPTKNIPQERQTRMAISSQVRREVWRRDGGVCVKCGSRRNLEYDHIVPVSKGGSNTARNIELLCETCNRSKSASIC